MIADSPYRADEAVLTPGQGICAGVVASLLMLVVILILQRLSGPSASGLLIRIARTILPLRGMALGPGSTLIVGAAMYLLVGALLGLLYAVSQDRAPARALIAVGLVYGFLIWLGGRAITSWFFGSSFKAAFHSYAWFVACLVYGALLAGYAAWVDRHRPLSARAVPVD